MYSIGLKSSEPVIIFAAQELKKYLRMMMPECGDIKISKDGSYTLGLSDVRSDEDIISIDCGECGGTIEGSNPRAVLLAVYRFLKENGCRFLRPGSDGELIPKKKVCAVKYHRKAEYSFRGQCMEGAVSQLNMLESVDWSAKAGLNSYMLEFGEPYLFYNKWYSHRNNKYKRPEPVTMEMARGYKAQLECEIERRGLSFHDVGIGYACDSSAAEGKPWYRSGSWDSDASAEKLCGESENGVLLKDGICVANEGFVEAVAASVADYAQMHGNAEYIHIWLANSAKLRCPCPKCTSMLPSDRYVILLNEMDRQFTARGIDTKLVFVVSGDLYWAPESEKLINPERFSMLFAPSSRNFNDTYAAEPNFGKTVPYREKTAGAEGSLSSDLAYLYEWKKAYKGKIFLYEYHFWMDHYLDPGYFSIAKNLYEDVRALKKHGISGMIEDQTQRSFMPTGFPMYVLSEAMFDVDITFDELCEDYFSHAFGEEWRLALEYLKAVSDAFDPGFMRCGSGSFFNEEQAKKLETVEELAYDFLPIIDRNSKQQERSIEISWKILYYHTKLITRLSKAMLFKARGKELLAYMHWEETMDYVMTNEDNFQSVFDVEMFIATMRNRIFGTKPSHE